MKNLTEVEVTSIDRNSKIILSIKDKLYNAQYYRLASVNLSSPVFSADIDRIAIEETELTGFVKDLEHLEEVRQGELTLSADNPEHFSLTLKSIDKLGHFEVVLLLGQDDNYKNKLNISFEIDPSTLPILLLHLGGCKDARKEDQKIKTNDYRKNAETVNEFLEEWDFIHVLPFGITGEYSDLINPILNLLSKNASMEEISRVISKKITETYGISMSEKDNDVQLFSQRIVNWWNSK